MKKLPKVSRRSFLGSVVGAATGSMFLTAGDAEAFQSGCTDRDPAPPRGDPSGRGRNCTATPTPTPTPPPTGCSDSDSGAGSDPGGRGRNCASRPNTGCSDSDSGSGSDPGGRGRSCNGGDNGRYVTGRRERRYEVCWVDSPNRSNDECNMQTYSEWATTYSDGRVEYDTAEADARKASMTSRGYTARWHRILQDW